MLKLQKIISDFKKQNPTNKTNIQFVGRISDQDLNKYLQTTKGFLFPGKEDFGIAPVEALAAGVPVIAYQSGGALEYVQEDINGIFFKEQEVKSLKKAILKFENKKDWDFQKIKKTSQKFSEEKFEEYFVQSLG
jgi:glycosyltransferase involved in cell wall biosynthesis